MGTKHRRSHVCLHSQVGIRQFTDNESAIPRYTIIISAQKLAQVIKSNTIAFQRIHRYARKILKRILKKNNITKTAEINWY